MNNITEPALRALLRRFGAPELVATHLRVDIKDVHYQMRLFGVHQNHAELQRTISSAGLSVGAAADTLGVRRVTVQRAMEEILPPETAEPSDEERQIRQALKAAGHKPAIAARSLLMELTTLYERMNEFGINLPARFYSVADRRRIVQQIRMERPGMGIRDIATLIKVGYSTLRQALQDPPSELKNFSEDLQRTLKKSGFLKMSEYDKYEVDLASFFANNNPETKLMREGPQKKSFVYLLIDPRVSCNLPDEAMNMEKLEIWKRFLRSIFYVGKGKGCRPYTHMEDALKDHTQQDTQQAASSVSKKVERIRAIWADSHGVVCMHVFHNTTPSDAYTREAAIIEALSLRHLTNLQRGSFYGPAATWSMEEKKYLGIALLYKAMHMYLAEGETQLSPSDMLKLTSVKVPELGA